MSPANGHENKIAEDVKYSIERQMTNDPGKFQHAYFFLNKMAKIEAVDKYTVKFTTNKPMAPFMNYIASPWTMIVLKEVVEKHGDLQRHDRHRPVHHAGVPARQEAVFVKNPTYFRKGLPYLDEVRLQYVIDPTAATAASAGADRHLVPRVRRRAIDQAVEREGDHRRDHHEFPIVLRTRPYDDQRPTSRRSPRRRCARRSRPRSSRRSSSRSCAAAGHHDDGPDPDLPETVGAAGVRAAGVRHREGQAPARRGGLRQRLQPS